MIDARICSLGLMLIDFRVKNFLSFKGAQTLSFVANNRDKSMPEAIIDPQLAGAEFARIRLLKGLVIYGANAAGKTNTLGAMGFLKTMVQGSATDLDEGDPTRVKPFKFDPNTPNEPTEFFVRFIVEGVRYHFSLELNRERILYESLSAFPKGREQVWYARSWDDNEQDYTWEPARPTDYRRDANLVKYTRSNALYLSTAVKFNDEQLRPIYRWFKEKLCLVRLHSDFPPITPDYTGKQVLADPNRRAQVTRLLLNADLGILSAKASEYQIQADQISGDIPEELMQQLVDKKQIEIDFGHKGAEGREYPLQWEQESSGTQKLFILSGPWLDILEKGYTAGLDEIDSSMHPIMVHALLRMVFSNTTNANGAQLVFTTHNPLLMDADLMRRDQIWFAEKDDEGATYLYPLTDYKPRKKESLVRGYMAGRYGAVPFIPKDLMGDATNPSTSSKRH